MAKAKVPFNKRQILVNRLMVALVDKLKVNVTLEQLERAYAAVERQYTFTSKDELKSELEENRKRIAELENRLEKAHNHDAALQDAENSIDDLFDND